MITTYSLMISPEARKSFAQFTNPESKVLIAPQNISQPANDSFVSSKPINKKLAIASGITAAVLIGAGIIHAANTGRFEFIKAKLLQRKADIINTEADEIKIQAKSVFKKTQQTVDEVLEYIKDGKKNGFQDVLDGSGSIIRRFRETTDENSTYKIMEEIGASGEITRLTGFDAASLNIETIEEIMGRTKTRIAGLRLDADNNVIDCIVAKGYRQLENGNIHLSEVYVRKGTLLSEYLSDVNANIENGNSIIKKGYGFTNGLLSRAAIDATNGKTENCAKYLFKYRGSTGDLIQVDGNSHSHFVKSNGYKTYKKICAETRYDYLDGITIQKGFEQNIGDGVKCKSQFKFDKKGRFVRPNSK